MHILVVGANHRSCPIEVRERLAFGAEQVPDALASLRDALGLSEALILSTCNRIEIYAAVPMLDGTLDRLTAFLSQRAGLRHIELADQFYHYTEPDSVLHLFSVASGLDSMVLGEAEILHQVKHAYELAKGAGSTGKLFNVLFQKALNAGKAVRTKTGIGRGCMSVGTVAVELAQKIFGDLTPFTVLLVGAGKIGELTMKRLADRGVSDLRIANRSMDRAAGLAARYGATAFTLDALGQQLLDADIVITSTSSSSALLTRDDALAIMRHRRARPLCVIDLGVPRNVEPSVGELENVYRFDIDDLQGLVDHSTAQRQQAVDASQTILREKVARFLAWWHHDHASCARSPLALAEAP